MGVSQSWGPSGMLRLILELYWGYIRRMFRSYWGYVIGVARLYWGYIGIMQNKIETTI